MAVDLKKLLAEFSVGTTETDLFTPGPPTAVKRSPAFAVMSALQTQRAVRKVARQEGISTQEAASRLRQTGKEIGIGQAKLRGILKARPGRTLSSAEAVRKITQEGGRESLRVPRAIATLVVQQAVKSPDSGVVRAPRTDFASLPGPLGKALKRRRKALSK